MAYAKKTSEYADKKARLDQEIAEGKRYPCYLFYGEEAYLRAQLTDGLIKKLGVPEGDINHTRYNGPETSADEVIEMAMTEPFFAPLRVIYLKNTGWFAAAGENGTKIAAYLKEPASTACLIFQESSVNGSTSAFKAANREGFTVNCDPPTGDLLKKWISGRFHANGMKIETRAADRLYELATGGASNEPRTDMNLLEQEMEKLLSYCYGRTEVRIADVEAVCSDTVMDRVFQLVDCMAERNGSGACALYQEMLANKVEPFRMLALIVRQYNNILQVRELQRAHLSSEEIRTRLSLHPFLIRKCTEWGKRYTDAQLVQILDLCAESERNAKRGRMTDVAAIESLIVESTLGMRTA